ncbi:hypothetical protein XELAEV_18041164mg [Xenopus laevis]|uniref:Secreted protein n=1 Tax=Xenopus laevis TaxID=8355 RepID=A0A974C270_XENLA|nr:hypothetical protein XELAEV_18041164mg [Xenopus laevis]
MNGAPCSILFFILCLDTKSSPLYCSQILLSFPKVSIFLRSNLQYNESTHISWLLLLIYTRKVFLNGIANENEN